MTYFHYGYFKTATVDYSNFNENDGLYGKEIILLFVVF